MIARRGEGSIAHGDVDDAGVVPVEQGDADEFLALVGPPL